MSTSGLRSTSPARFVCGVDNRFPYFYLSESEPVSIPLASGWGGLVEVRSGRLQMRMPSSTRAATVFVEVHEEEPVGAADDYEDVVEVGYRSPTGNPAVLDWSKALVDPLKPLPCGPGDYRVRYHVRSTKPGQLVEFWPAKPKEPEEVKVTGALGNFWHPGGRLRRALSS